jgi:hypothetical protein
VNIRVISLALVEPSPKGAPPIHGLDRRLESGAQLPADCNRLFSPAAQLLLSPARLQILCDRWQWHRFRQSSRHATPHRPDQVKRLRQFAPRR